MWKKCRKLPVIIEVREVKHNEFGIETLEGYKECNLADHFILKGVRGEEYPIRQDIFNETYEVLDESITE